MIRTGSMKEEISIQSQTAVSDGQGGSTVTWSTIASEWAKVTQLSYSRSLSEGGIQFVAAYNFEMRKRGDTYTLSGVNRIVWNSVNYTVHSTVENKDRIIILAYR